MTSDRQRLRGAKRRVDELEKEIQSFVDKHPQMSKRQIENHPTIKRLTRLANNAENVVNQLEEHIRKRR